MVVKLLLQSRARPDCKARLGAWSWDLRSEEVLRVEAGMAKPFDATWCAIKYWESTGSILRMLLEHENVNSELQGRSLLCHAVLCNNDEATQILLRRGANVEFCICTEDGAEFRPIHISSKRGLMSVLKKNALLKQSTNFSPLHFTAYLGDAKVVRQLLERNDVDLDHQDKFGLTVAMIAAQKRHIEVFKELIFAGANISMKSTKGAIAMKLAEENGYKELCKRVMCGAITAGVLQGDDFKEIHFAARGNCELLLHLLKHGHSINSLDSQGSTPLMTCVREGHIDACKLLLNEGADCYISNRVGETALSLAPASKKMVEEIILDHITKKVVLTVAQLSKHTKQGKGSPHLKSIKLLKSGVLSWGSSKKHNVYCMEKD
ncbi:hypothetical protein L7F22_066668 [Adiantum nelumboides]|nr:hypothetical protein [Adiantum nelumboides]